MRRKLLKRSIFRVARLLAIPPIILTTAGITWGSLPQYPERNAPVQNSAAQKPASRGLNLAHAVYRLRLAIPRLMAEGEVPGLSIALVQEGQLVWTQGFGVTDSSTGIPVGALTEFQAASMSKPVFAVGVLKLVDAGKLDLDTPLSKYMPKPYIEGDDRINRITARMVLTHSTGFPNWRPRGGPLKINFEPGSRFSYSGEGFVYLQKVVEHITGKSLNDYLAKSVLDPLGMKGSSYVWDDRLARYINKSQAGFATGHNVAGLADPESHPTSANAAASLITNAIDYGKFVTALMNGTGLKPATWKAMLTPEIKVNEGCLGCLSTERLTAPSTVAWGLGIGIQQTALGPAFWHWGDNGDAGQCFMIGFERQQAGIVILTNSANGQSIIPEIIRLATMTDLPSTAWLHYDAYSSPPRAMFHSIMAQGADVELKKYVARRDSLPEAQRLTESQMNRLGYWLIAAKKIEDAIKVFEQNVADYPRSSNVYDSLGEAYMDAGENEAALRNYKKSLELDPQNTNAAKMIEKLEQK